MIPLQHPRIIRITTVPISLLLLLKGQMKYMKHHGFEVIMISSPGPEAEKVEDQEGCEMITIPMKRTVHLLEDIKSLYRLYLMLKKLKPDIVHTHTPKAGLLGMLAATFAGVPVRMHTIAGIPWMENKGLSRYILKQVERITAFAAHAIYPNSKGLMEFMEKENIVFRKRKMKMIGHGTSNGIDLSYYQRSEVPEGVIRNLKIKSEHSADGFIWIFIGRLVSDKGIKELVDAFCQLQLQFPDDQLWLVGEEEEKRDPLPIATRDLMHQHNSIIQWGFQKDVRPYLAAASALVFPSYREGFPNVPLQAAAMECPMILSDINGCNEIVSHGINGLLVPPKNTTALYDAMRSFRTNISERTKMATRSREHIAAHFSRDVIWQLLESEYRMMLSQREKS